MSHSHSIGSISRATGSGRCAISIRTHLGTKHTLTIHSGPGQDQGHPYPLSRCEEDYPGQNQLGSVCQQGTRNGATFHGTIRRTGGLLHGGYDLIPQAGSADRISVHKVVFALLRLRRESRPMCQVPCRDLPWLKDLKAGLCRLASGHRGQGLRILLPVVCKAPH